MFVSIYGIIYTHSSTG